ncbi:MAG TPA: hypothetical protein DCQ64_23910 [Candidatus Rokubacteria bacterium]|nr:hypothetical protein [Candidatus Rokubacteria bacterium]
MRRIKRVPRKEWRNQSAAERIGTVIVLLVLLFGCAWITRACTRSFNEFSREQDATATAVVVGGTLTAEAPTATPEPSETPTAADTPRLTAKPSATPDLRGAFDAMKQKMEAANEAAGDKFFLALNLKQGGQRCEITIGDAWYLLPDYEQERLVELLGDQYALVASTYGLRGAEPNEANYPTTSLVDSFGKEVAYKSTWRTKVVR